MRAVRKRLGLEDTLIGFHEPPALDLPVQLLCRLDLSLLIRFNGVGRETVDGLGDGFGIV